VWKDLRMEYKPSDYYQSIGVFENVPAMRFAEFVEFLKEKEEGNKNANNN
jgi:hypothetical protein